MPFRAGCLGHCGGSRGLRVLPRPRPACPLGDHGAQLAAM